MKNKSSIAKEIAALRELRARLPEFNLLGESVHRHIDTQISFLEKRVADFAGAKLDLAAGKKTVANNHAELQALRWMDADEDADEAPSKTYDPVYRTRLRKSEIAAGKARP